MEIISYQPRYQATFRDLNVEWLEKYFFVEPVDEEVLQHPEKYIIAPGGTIFLARLPEGVVGTVALMKLEEGVFELTKMAVTGAAQGKKIGQKLMQHAIDYARQQNWKKLIIYTNSGLVNAVHIYKKYGFVEIPVEPGVQYERADIKMKLDLS